MNCVYYQTVFGVNVTEVWTLLDGTIVIDGNV